MHAPGTSWHQPEPTRPAPSSPPPGWVMAPAPEADRKRIRFEILTVLLIAAVPGFIIGLEGIGDPQTVTTDIATLELLAMVASAAGPAVLAYHFLWRDRRLGIAGFGRRSPGFVIGYGLLGLVAVYGALISVSIVVESIRLALGGEVRDAEAVGDGVALTAASLAVAYVISITAGVTEEIVFRAYAITRLEELGWRRAAVWAPGVVFTLLHLYQGLAAILYIGAITVVFTWLYRWKRSIWPVMVAHALFDGVQLTLAAVLAA